MADTTDVLLSLYNDAIAYCRHQEEQRATMTSLILAICAALLGIVGLDDHVSSADLPFAAFLVVLGSFGAVFSAKQYERFDLHQERGKEFRREIERLHPGTGIPSLRKAAAETTKAEHPILYPIPLHWFWIGLPLIVAGVGALLVAYILLGGT